MSVGKTTRTRKVSHESLVSHKDDRSQSSQEIPPSIVVSDLDGKPRLNSKMSNFKWWLSALLAIFACLQIARGVTATRDSATEQHEPPVQFPDLYEASVLELQEGLDAGHFSSVDLVKVRDPQKQQYPSSSEIGLYRHILRGLMRLI